MNRFRVGSKVGRTIYDGDELCGVMDTRALALNFVAAVNHGATRDLEWIACFESIDSQIAFTGNPHSYVSAVLAPLIDRANREAALAVKLRNLCEEPSETLS